MLGCIASDASGVSEEEDRPAAHPIGIGAGQPLLMRASEREKDPDGATRLDDPRFAECVGIVRLTSKRLRGEIDADGFLADDGAAVEVDEDDRIKESIIVIDLDGSDARTDTRKRSLHRSKGAVRAIGMRIVVYTTIAGGWRTGATP
jgi:hypothetical protein